MAKKDLDIGSGRKTETHLYAAFLVQLLSGAVRPTRLYLDVVSGKQKLSYDEKP